MGIFKKIIFPARFGVFLCGRWFNFAPWRSVCFLMYYAVALQFAVMFLFLDLFDEWYTYMQFNAVVGPTAPKLMALVFLGLFLLIHTLNIMAVSWAIFILVIGVCLPMPAVPSAGYLFCRRHIRTMADIGQPPQN